jgi:hypothetical protein
MDVTASDLEGAGVFLMPGSHETPDGARGPRSSICAAPSHVSLGRQLRRLRVERGLSRKVVAASLGLSVKRIEGHERGTRKIEARELVAYTRLYQVRLADLFRDLPTGGNGEF